MLNNLLTQSFKINSVLNVVKIHSPSLSQSNAGLVKVETCLSSLSFIDHCQKRNNSTLLYKTKLFNSKRFPVNRNFISSQRSTTRLTEPVDNEDQYNSALQCLWNLRNLYKEADVKNTLLSDATFREVCITLMKKLRYLTPMQVHSLAHLVLGINLPTNIGIIKGVLQMLRVHLNEFDARQLADIYRLLERNQSFERDPEEIKEPSNPVIEALLIAIPKALEIKITGKQFNANNPSHLLSILKSATMAKLEIDPIRFLLLVISNKLKFMNFSDLNQLFGHLCHPHIESNIDLIGRQLIQQTLETCWQKITPHFNDCNFEIDYFFDETLRALSLTKDNIYYNQLFCDAVYDVYKRCDSFENLDAFDDFLWFGLKYDHYSLQSLEKVLSLIIANPDSFLWESSLSSCNIIRALGRLNWKPSVINWNILRPILFEDIKLSGSPYYSSIKTMISCLTLKEHDLFEELSDREISNIFEIPDLDPSIFYQDILTLNIGVTCEASHTTPSALKSTLNSYLKEAIEFLNSTRDPSQFQQSLSVFLSLCCGSQDKIVNNVWTSHGHFIDNLIMINEEGIPVTFNEIDNHNEPKFLHNYQIDPQNQLVAVLPITDNDFCVKPYKLKGEVDLRFRTLEKLGIKILRIHLDTWKCLSERERCKFMVRELGVLIGQEFKSDITERV